MNEDMDQRDENEVRLRSLMQDGIPTGRPGNEFKRRLGTVLDHNFRNDRHRTRTVVVLTTIVVMALVSGRFRNVGSDSFDLMPLEGHTASDSGLVILKAPFAGDGINVPPGYEDAEEGHRAAESLREQLMAGVAPLIRVEGWGFGDETCYMLIRETEYEGRTHEVSTLYGEVDRDFLKHIYGFLIEHADDLSDRVAAGMVPASGVRTRTFDGQTITLTIYRAEYPEWGEVIYEIGVP